MTTIVTTVTVHAGPDDVWGVLADLTATRLWLPGVTDARMHGDTRVCTIAGGGEIHERISDVDPARRSYRFAYLRTPLPVRDAGGTFTVEPGDAEGTAVVTLRLTFEPLDAGAAAAVEEMIRGAFGDALTSLRRYVEEKSTWDAG
jgi:uncharacterized protein YndB with AHSA1/START domain